MPYEGLKVIDFHVHLPIWRRPREATASTAAEHAKKPDLNQEYSLERRRQWRLEWGFPEPEDTSGVSEELIAKRWAAEVEKSGLEKVVLVTGGGNENLVRLVEPYRDKLIPFAHHDLAGPDAPDQLKRAVEELGCKGYKIIAPTLTIDSFDRPELEPLWTYMEDRQLPLLIHFGWLGTGGGIVDHPLINPLRIYPVAHRHPALPIVIAHFGCGYFGELLQLCWSCPSVYADTSGSNQWVRWMPYPLDLEGLFRKTYETIGSGRIIFGTDSSWFPRGFSSRYLEEQVRACRWIGMKEEDLRAVFGGNAAKLLGVGL
ncbi:MAG TPA: amidohydrolase family protein [Bacillota bacterium]|jgi:hypothetical protein